MPEGGALIEFLSDLDRRRVRLRAEGDRLRCLAPAGVLTDELLARIEASKVDILRHLQGRQSLPLADRQVPIPLSFQQEQIWLAQHLDPNSSAYNVPLDVRLIGSLRPETLAQALTEIARRHESLRTTFPVRHGRPHQQVAAFAPQPVPLVDLSALPPDLREGVAGSLALSAARRPFDLSLGPVTRYALMRVDAGEYRLSLTRHHISSDGWSFGVLATELSAHYQAYLSGRPSTLAPLPRQYVDFAAWQREAASAPSQRERAARWRTRLEGASTGLTLVAAARQHSRPGETGSAKPAGALRGDVPSTTAASVRRLAREAGVTAFPVLLSAFALALASAAGQREVVVGVAASGRSRSELEPMIGDFATILPLRLAPGGASTFRDAVRHTQDVVTEALADQDMPVELLADALRPDLGRPVGPRVAVAFAFQNTPEGHIDLPGVVVEASEPVPLAPKFPLTVTVTTSGDGLRLVAEHDTRLLPGTVVAAVFERFLEALRLGCESPSLSPAEIAVRAARTATVTEPPIALGGAHALGTAFGAVAAKRPDAIAVCQDGVQMSYAALYRRARWLAGQLRAVGVRAETPVGVCVAHGPDLVIALVGITLSGGCYVPVDPEDPPIRQEAVLVDAGIGVLVTHAAHAQQFAWFDGMVLQVDREPIPACGTAPDPGRGVGGDNLAYVIYTSGSTGSPKGVMASHNNVLSMFAAAEEVYRFTQEDVWSLAHSSAFDFSVWEIWGPLLTGGRLVVLPRTLVRDPPELWRVLTVEQVTILSATPSAFQSLVGPAIAASDGPACSMRAVVLGGERCEPAKLRAWFQTFGDRRPAVVNMYGITETTVHVTHRQLELADTGRDGSPIGVPLAGWVVYVVDPHGVPTVVGGHGEMLVGGAGVARGYLGRPGLTAERYRPDHLGGQPGDRLYASGDLAQVLAGGELAYLGRSDHQVKIRGYRIEPAEIESVLMAHPAVSEAAVVVSHSDERAMLVACVVPTRTRPGSTASLSIGELRRHCADRLPRHLVPAGYTVLDALPLTRNGKVDRTSLVELARSALVPTSAGPPQTETQQALATLWCELLGVATVGIDDDFFDVGGDSLLLTRLHARLPELFSVQLSMRQLYEKLTIASQASAIDALRQQESLGTPAGTGSPAADSGR